MSEDSPHATVRVLLPDQLQRLARLEREVAVAVTGAVTQRSVLDALEAGYPALRGTIRDHAGRRRPKVRIFACNEDISHHSPDAPLPPADRLGRGATVHTGGDVRGLSNLGRAALPRASAAPRVRSQRPVRPSTVAGM